MSWLDAGPDDLSEAEPTCRNVAGTEIVLLRQGEQLYAFDVLCPHKFAALAEGTVGQGCITCPQHDATFNLRTGQPGADEAWAGRLPVHGVRALDGRIQVQLAP